MALTMDEARARVAKGATHLDTVRPGWFNRIDVGTLTLHDPCGCIVGQLCGLSNVWDFDDAVSRLGIEDDIAMGFDLKGLVPFSLRNDLTDSRRAPYYKPLQDAWLEAIAARRFPVVDTPQPDLVGAMDK